jgi:hypothetical protein
MFGQNLMRADMKRKAILQSIDLSATHGWGQKKWSRRHGCAFFLKWGKSQAIGVRGRGGLVVCA